MALGEQAFRYTVRHWVQVSLFSIISSLLGAPNLQLRFNPERVAKLQEDIARALADFINETPVEPVQELVTGDLATEWAQKLNRSIAKTLRMSEEWWESYDQYIATLKNSRPSGRN